jgi:multicomponent Na+:H+ antiporter subunit E
LRELRQQQGIEIVEGHAMADHIHLRLSIPPKYSVASTAFTAMLLLFKPGGICGFRRVGSRSPLESAWGDTTFPGASIEGLSLESMSRSESQTPSAPLPEQGRALTNMPIGSANGRSWSKVGRLLLSVAALAAIWLVIADANLGSWMIGGPAVVAAAWAAGRLGTGVGIRLSLGGLILFIPFFLWESLRGGVDVALRSLGPRLRVNPGFTRYHIRLASPSGRVFMVSCVSLLPGTLSAELDGEWLTVHVLSIDGDSNKELQRLEEVVARLFSEPIERSR